MNKQAFIELLKNPASMNASDLKGLEEVIYNYPYFQAAHLLAAKGFKDQGKMLAEQKVRKAAAYAGERGRLKKLLSKLKGDNNKNKQAALALPVEALKHKEEQVKPVEQGQSIKKSDSVLQEAPIVKKEDNTSALNLESKEAKNTKENNHISEDIQKTLSSLRATMSKLTETIEETINPKTEDLLVKETVKPEEEIKSSPEIPQHFAEEKPIESKNDLKTTSELIPEKIKEHNDQDLLFSSRLDGILTNSDNNDRFKNVNEGDLLLDYLSFLEISKKSVKDKKKTEEIIEKFIREDPSIPPLTKAKLVEEQEDKASGSYTLKSSPLSESMAKIFLLQGKKDKAIEIYNQLLLKYPEKKDYFASQIEKIK